MRRYRVASPQFFSSSDSSRHYWLAWLRRLPVGFSILLDSMPCLRLTEAIPFPITYIGGSSIYIQNLFWLYSIVKGVG